MKTLQTIVTATLLMMTFSVYADYTIDRGAIRTWKQQDVVITVSQDLTDTENLEEAVEATCLALTLGQFLRDHNLNNGNRKVNVTIFLRNDGVSLADKSAVQGAGNCTVPNPNFPFASADPFIEIPLEMNLMGFIAGNDNNLVNCPLCWIARHCTEWSVSGSCIAWEKPDYGGSLDNNAIPEVLLGADKVIDF